MKRQALSIILLCVFTTSILGCDFIYSLLHKEGAQEKELLGDPVPFQANPRIEHVQALLKLYGYFPGRVDGVLGFVTRAAISKFQKDNSLKQSGFVDDPTWAKLKSFEDSGFVFEQKLNVKLIQEILKKKGYSVGKVDGVWGHRTEAAVKAFQKKNGLAPDGKVGYKTLTALAAYR